MLKLKIQKTVGTFQFKLRFPSGRIRAVTNRLRYNCLKHYRNQYISKRSIVGIPTSNSRS